MKSFIRSVARRVVNLFIPDSVRFENAILPAKHLRLCGPEFRRDSYFLASAKAEADRLIQQFGLTEKSSVLDVGCGVGRLTIGIISQLGNIQKYRGIDISKASIRWCQKHITSKHPNFQFIHIDASNPRYNPKGVKIGVDFKLPFDDHEFDIIYLYSVFSHMTTDDIKVYLKEFKRILTRSGKIFLTAFIADGVPDMTINPPNYQLKNWSGPLHCVRYNKDFFSALLAENDFVLDRMDYEQETNGQSAIYVSKRK